MIRAARVLLVDHFGVAGMIRAARIARDARIPVVADFESADDPQFPTLLALVDHLILSRDFAAHVTGQQDPATAVRALWTAERRAAVVTCGREGCWYVSDDQPGTAASSTGAGRGGGRHDGLRRRVSRRLCGGVGSWPGRSRGRAVRLGGGRLEGHLPRRPGGHPLAFRRRGADGKGVSQPCSMIRGKH